MKPNNSINPSDRYIIHNLVTDNQVESHPSGMSAMAACQYLNYHTVRFCRSTARYIVIDMMTTEKFYTDLEYKL